LKKSPISTFFRQNASGLALAVLSGAVCLGLLEGFVRVFYRSKVDSTILSAKRPPASVVPFVRRTSVPGLLYDLKPGARVLGWGSIKVEVDPSGCCRVVPGHLADEGTGLKIAILGDSTPFGWKVPFEETYGELLRPLLPGTSIRNFAVPGYNSEQNLAAFRSKALGWRPDLIVLHYDHNDSEPADDSRASFLFPSYGDNFLHSMLVKLVLREATRLRPVRRTLAVPGDPRHPELLLHDYRYAGPQFERHMAEMQALADLAALHKIPVLVFMWNPWLTRARDPLSDPFYTLLHRPVADRLRGMGFRVADGYALYQDYMRREGKNDLTVLWASAEDAHPSALGHRVIARYLAGEIKTWRGVFVSGDASARR
jgi:lysophospholipase L1-like esterase